MDTSSVAHIIGTSSMASFLNTSSMASFLKEPRCLQRPLKNGNEFVTLVEPRVEYQCKGSFSQPYEFLSLEAVLGNTNLNVWTLARRYCECENSRRQRKPQNTHPFTQNNYHAVAK